MAIGKDSKDPADRSRNWTTPSVQEQYEFWQPIARSVSIMIATYQTAYEVTGDALYLAKAMSLANTLTYVQTFNRDRMYPTYLTPVNRQRLWLNNVVYPALAMLELGRFVDRRTPVRSGVTEQ